MEGWSLLSAFSLAMFIGSYLAGSIPLAFTFSETRMRMISIFGAGLLVGTALSVIIPEGVEALYDSRIETVHPRHDHHHDHNGHEAKNILEQNSLHQPEHPPRLIPRDVQQPDGVGDGKESRSKRQIPPVDGRHLLQVQQSPPGNKGVEEHGHEEHGHGTHQSIGIALVMGFLLMLVVDQVTRSASSRSIDGISRPRIKITATVGLVVHAAADGIALGSAASTNKTDVQLIVFVAIMLHKAPAAFGLVTFLLLEGLERHRIKRHLLIFALAAPLMAIFTFYTLTVIGSETLSGGSTTGILMLFSAGTFLYVATVHVLPELVNQRSSGGDISFTSGHSHSSGVAFNVIELVSLIIGAVLPAILSLGHSH